MQLPVLLLVLSEIWCSKMVLKKGVGPVPAFGFQ